MTTLPFTDNVIPQLQRWREAGLGGALATVVHIDGRGPRPVGSQIAVNENSEHIGQITSGCAETAIIQQAVDHIAQRTNVLTRFGKGSSFLDIELPCGSGIDVYFDSQLPTDMIAKIASETGARRPISLTFDTTTHQHTLQRSNTQKISSTRLTTDANGMPTRHYQPRTRLIAAGTGLNLISFITLATSLDMDVIALSPEADTLEEIAPMCSSTVTLTSPDDFDPDLLDPWTACALLFHDHIWEPVMMKPMIESDSFYIGALGSKATHQARIEALESIGAAPDAIARISAPIGLDIGASTPPAIALSILAEIEQAAART